MELRVGGSARATRDLDAALRGAITELAEHLDPALRAGWGDFAATRTELEPIRDTGAVRCQHQDQRPTSPDRDRAGRGAEVEASMGSEVDHVPARPLSDLGIETPGSVPCIADTHHPGRLGRRVPPSRDRHRLHSDRRRTGGRGHPHAHRPNRPGEQRPRSPPERLGPKNRTTQACDLGLCVELRRIELLTSSMPWKRSTN